MKIVQKKYEKNVCSLAEFFNLVNINSPACALLIQSTPGASFYINGSKIFIGKTGQYEIKQEDGVEITDFEITTETANLILNAPTPKLIVLMLKEE